jgi:hypothetical protein
MMRLILRVILFDAIEVLMFHGLFGGDSFSMIIGQHLGEKVYGFIGAER